MKISPLFILLIIAGFFMARFGISKTGLLNIKNFESLRLKPYLDIAGKPHIGYGHLIKSNEQYLLTGQITKQKAEQLLVNDLTIAQNAVNKYVTGELTSNQYDALVSFVFNVGVSAFRKSTMLRLINSGETNRAGLEFSRWIFAKGKKSTGLIKRRSIEQKLFMA